MISRVTIGMCVVVLLSVSVNAEQIGETKWIDGPTYGASANWNESKTSPVAFAQIDDGWTVIGYQDVRYSSFGRTSINVSYLQAGGTFVASGQVASSFDSAINAAMQKGLQGYAAQLTNQKNTWTSYVTQMASSHKTISVTATATGSGNPFDQKGASISGKLRIRVQYLGTPNYLSNYLNGIVNKINSSFINFEVHNNCQTEVWIAINFYSNNVWNTVGWFTLAPGQTRHLASAQSKVAYYHAHDSYGRVWAGDYYYPVDKAKPFMFVNYNTQGDTDAKTVGFRQIELHDGPADIMINP